MVAVGLICVSPEANMVSLIAGWLRNPRLSGMAMDLGRSVLLLTAELEHNPCQVAEAVLIVRIRDRVGIAS